MKNKILLLGLVFIHLSHASMAAEPNASVAASSEKEYLDAVVLLIDPPTGMLGISMENETTRAQEKYSFKVDPQKTDITNPANDYLEFTDISIGDHMDIYTVVNANGKEEVVEIYDYNAVEKDEE